jgi:catechol 2,3-dioxygenase-like lactoylglutathione lyase family enzyme
MAWDLRIELFAGDLDRFADFYTRVLGFTVADDRRDSDVPYLSVRRDGVRFGAVLAGQPVDRAARAFPAGAEIVLEVDDIAGERDRVVAAGWPLADDLQARPWGLTDFRVYDPDGYLLRLTNRPGT